MNSFLEEKKIKYLLFISLVVFTAFFSLFYGWVLFYYFDILTYSNYITFDDVSGIILLSFASLPLPAFCFAYMFGSKKNALILALILLVISLLFVYLAMPIEVYIPIVVALLSYPLGLVMRRKQSRISNISTCVAFAGIYFVCLYLGGLSMFYLHSFSPYLVDQSDILVQKLEPDVKSYYTNVYSEDWLDLYTGAIDVYEKRLKIDPLPHNLSALAYYVEGKEFGVSTSKVTIHNYSGERFFLFSPEIYTLNFSPEEKVLVHKDYTKKVQEEVQSWGDYYFRHQDSDIFDISEVIFEKVKDGKPYLMKKNITYHQNGLIEDIETEYLDLQLGQTSSWKRDLTKETLRFDSLGFDLSLKAWNGLWARQWYREDFVLTSGLELDYKKYISKPEPELYKRFVAPEKMDYAPFPYAWQNESNFDNLISVFGLDLGKALTITVYGKGSPRELKQSDILYFINLIDKSKLASIPFEKNIDIEVRQIDSVTIELSVEEKTLKLYYLDQVFLVENGPYCFELDLKNLLTENELEAERKLHYSYNSAPTHDPQMPKHLDCSGCW